MLDKIINILPELPLAIGIIHLCVWYILGNRMAKSYASISRFWLVISVLSTILCYYQKNVMVSDSYTLLFVLCADIILYIIMILSSSWFTSLKRTGGRYYILLLLAATGTNVILNTNNLAVFGICYTSLSIISALLYSIRTAQQQLNLKKYLLISTLILMILILGLIHTGLMLNGDLSAEQVKIFLEEHNQSLFAYLSVVGILVPLLYTLGIVPFHATTEDKACCCVLPVSHYFSLFLPIVSWGCLIKINQIIYPIYADTLSQIYQILALASVILGAIGANMHKNLHGIYAYSSIYHFGIILFLLSLGQESAIFAAFIYLLCYLLVLGNLYAVFYNLKTHGQYISDVNALAGLAQTRPYTTGALLISLFSIIGVPPLVGFLGQLNMTAELLNTENYISIGIVFIALLFLAKAYLEIMKVLYFAPKTKPFDSENKYILFYIMMNTFAIILFTFNPLNVIEKIKDMFYVIFL